MTGFWEIYSVCRKNTWLTEIIKNVKLKTFLKMDLILEKCLDLNVLKMTGFWEIYSVCRKNTWLTEIIKNVFAFWYIFS